MIGYIKCEYIKIRRKYYWLYVILFALANAYVSSSLAAYMNSRQENIDNVAKVSLGQLAYTLNSNNFYMFGLPFLMTIFLAMYFHMESENDGWKLAKTSGGNIRKMIYAKLIIVFIFLLYVYCCQLIVTFAYEMYYQIPILSVSAIASMAVSILGAMLNCIFLFLFFMLVDSVVINIVIGIFALILNTIVIQTHYWKYIFTTYYYNVYSVTFRNQIEIFFVCAAGVFVVVLVLGNLAKARIR